MNCAAINPHTHFETDKRAWEEAIRYYNGNDPLDLWFNYISWLEQNKDYDQDNGFRRMLEQCLSNFESYENYKQDVRMIKLWMKFIDMQENPLNLYQILYNKDIGNKCSCFYIGWAHYYDAMNAFKNAESVYNLGVQKKAQPLEELQTAQNKFRLSLAQRMLYNDASSKKRSASTLVEQRQQITSLSSPPQKRVRVDGHDYSSQQVQVQQTQQQPAQTYSNNQNYYGNFQQQHPGVAATQSQPQSQSQPQPQTQTVQNQIHQNYYHDKQTTTYYAQSQSVQQNVQPHIQPVQPIQQETEQPIQQVQQHIQSVQQPAQSIQQPAQSIQQPVQQPVQAVQHAQLIQPVQNTQSVQHTPPLVRQQPIQQNRQQPPVQHSQLMQPPAQQQHLAVQQSPQPRSYQSNAVNQGYPDTSIQSEEIIECNLNNSAYVISSSLNYVYDDAETNNYSVNIQTDHEEEVVESNDSTLKYEEPVVEGIKLPPNFAIQAKNNNDIWMLPICLEEPYEINKRCMYPKHLVYPDLHTGQPSVEFSLEEIRARSVPREVPISRGMLHWRQQQVQKETERQNKLKIQQQREIEERNRQAHLHYQQQQQLRYQQQREEEEQKRKMIAMQQQQQQQQQQHYSYQQNSNQQYATNNYGNNRPNTVVYVQQHPHYPQHAAQQQLQPQPHQYHSQQQQVVQQQPPQQIKPQQPQQQHCTIYTQVLQNAVQPHQQSPQLPQHQIYSQPQVQQPQNVPQPQQVQTPKLANYQPDAPVAENEIQIQTTPAKSKGPVNDYDDFEEQIEASTIRFSTKTENGCKNKTLTIKFKKERPNPVASETVNETNNNGIAKKEKKVPSKEKKEKKEKKKNKLSKYLSFTDSNSTQMPPNGPSRKSIDDANLLLSLSANNNSNNSVDYFDEEDSNASEFNSAYSYAGDNSVNFGGSSCSTPMRNTPVNGLKTSTPVGTFNRFLKKQETSLSILNEDSMNSFTGAENSFFVTENDEAARKDRLAKALELIDEHLGRSWIDPFNSELCHALLTKADFPTREPTEDYRITRVKVSKPFKQQMVNFCGITYNVEKEVGRGSYGAVYRAVNTQTGGIVAIKYQKPPNPWELYICKEVRKRIKNPDVLPGIMDICSAVIGPNASVLVSEFAQYGSLLDINNKLRQATTKVMHESLVMHFSSQIMNIVEHLHSCNIIHADIKPDNFLLMKTPNVDSHVPTLRLIDFGCAIDMNFFEPKMQFNKIIQTDGFTCINMQESRPWSFETDLFCLAGTIHVMLFGDYMNLVKEGKRWNIKAKFPRYLKKHVWGDVFDKLLNIKDIDHLPNLSEMREMIDNEAYNMESELVKHIRTLTNLLKQR